MTKKKTPLSAELFKSLALHLQAQTVSDHRDEFAVCGLIHQRKTGDFVQSVPVRFPAYIDNGADVVFNVQGICFELYRQAGIDVLCDFYGLLLRIHRKGDGVGNEKVAFVGGIDSKFPDDPVNVFHSRLFSFPASQ